METSKITPLRNLYAMKQLHLKGEVENRTETSLKHGTKLHSTWQYQHLLLKWTIFFSVPVLMLGPDQGLCHRVALFISVAKMCFMTDGPENSRYRKD